MNWRILLVQKNPHALADRKQGIWISEKALEFLTVLSTLSLTWLVLAYVFEILEMSENLTAVREM